MQSTIFKSQQVLTQLRNAQVPIRNYIKVLQKDTLSDNVKKSEYAVRGKIPMRGEEIQTDINNGNGAKYPFATTTSLNIGNPQAVGQGHITFNREVLSCLINPLLLKTDVISHDAK
jgi:alanine transaminase